MKVVFAGGGTGGHIYPALAVAEELKKTRPDMELLFIGGKKGIESKIVKEAGYAFKTIPVIGLPRKLSPALVSFVWKLAVSVFLSRRILSRFMPAVVIATGGYVSGPPIIAARSLGLPVVIQEQNSYPGLTNRKLGRFADILFLGFKDASRYFGTTAETMVTGNPIRDFIVSGERRESAGAFGLDPGLKTVLVFGGSQGAAAINKAVSAAVQPLTEQNIQVLWQTGEKENEAWKSFDGSFGDMVRTVPYIGNMEQAYAAADLVIARAGAMSIAEITACGLPAVYIPLPSAAGNHQEHNARALVEARAAEMILERDLSSTTLEKRILGILSSDERLSTMSKASESLGKRDAAKVIAEIIVERYGK